MQKVKHRRTADCVVGGFRYAQKKSKGKKTAGSLLLGLYDDEGLLNHVGFTSSFAQSERAHITKIVERLAGGSGFSGKARGRPAVGARVEATLGKHSIPNWSSKWNTITLLAADSVMERGFCDGGQTRPPCNARWIRSLTAARRSCAFSMRRTNN